MDSSGWKNLSCLEAIGQYLNKEHVDKKGISLHKDHFKLEVAPNLPRQQNNDDCGVFVCLYSQALLNAKFPQSIYAEDISAVRLKIAWEIINNTIL